MKILVAYATKAGSTADWEAIRAWAGQVHDSLMQGGT